MTAPFDLTLSQTQFVIACELEDLPHRMRSYVRSHFRWADDRAAVVAAELAYQERRERGQAVAYVTASQIRRYVSAAMSAPAGRALGE